jgi:hypothetical protein
MTADSVPAEADASAFLARANARLLDATMTGRAERRAGGPRAARAAWGFTPVWLAR